MIESMLGQPYAWTAESGRTADHLDVVARVADLPTHSPLLVTVPGLAHPLADEPGLEPAPQLPVAALVDDIPTRWFVTQL